MSIRVNLHIAGKPDIRCFYISPDINFSGLHERVAILVNSLQFTLKFFDTSMTASNPQTVPLSVILGTQDELAIFLSLAKDSGTVLALNVVDLVTTDPRGQETDFDPVSRRLSRPIGGKYPLTPLSDLSTVLRDENDPEMVSEGVAGTSNVSRDRRHASPEIEPQRIRTPTTSPTSSTGILQPSTAPRLVNSRPRATHKLGARSHPRSRASELKHQYWNGRREDPVAFEKFRADCRERAKQVWVRRRAGQAPDNDKESEPNVEPAKRSVRTSKRGRR